MTDDIFVLGSARIGPIGETLSESVKKLSQQAAKRAIKKIDSKKEIGIVEFCKCGYTKNHLFFLEGAYRTLQAYIAKGHYAETCPDCGELIDLKQMKYKERKQMIKDNPDKRCIITHGEKNGISNPKEN